ncbi:flavin-containing monooxygenase [Gracilibacillus kekensis]|uniref:Putative flavoprotein involved in K+ transport n=1 Tax=Gracilibacillus kekensis TaxID=1027249 RepID=A0A1M7J355_9BACI|nr:NAD(P)/FAD-dependent oxidoreductase [Gracilibacillus kekensis]SHM47520.1 putative flavoprotein involved in K+ transport [Gracilibacillus kekensis]
MNQYKVIIVGAGQAGIAMGYYLMRENISFVILDKKERVGDSWRNRYDSLVLFTPRNYSSLPGLNMKGAPDKYPTKDEIAKYLEDYVSHFQLPVRYNVRVEKLTKTEKGRFRLITNKGIMEAEKVIVATGPFQTPFIPDVFQNSTERQTSIHSSDYKSPSYIDGDSVLVVGGGNSGAQIAVELSKIKKVTIAVNHSLRFLPLQIIGRSIFEWLDIFGFLFAESDSLKGKWFRNQKDPIFGNKLKLLIRKKQVTLKPKVISVSRHIVTFDDRSKQEYDQIIWATGFNADYHWIKTPDVISPHGNPIHKKGVSVISGLYFIGLPWQSQRGSALICGVSKDAQYLLSKILHEA